MNLNEMESVVCWDQKFFTQRIIKAVRGYDIPMRELPELLELKGIYHNIANDLVAQTMADPLKRERSRYAKVNTDGNQLLIPREVKVGTETDVFLGINLRIKRELLGLQYEYVREESVAFTFHTHGSADVPPSPFDFGLILSEPEDGSIAEFILTPSIRFLLIRSMDTPSFEQSELKRVMEAWKATLQAEISTVIGERRAIMQKFGGVSDAQVNLISAQVQLKTLKERCDLYKIGFYSSIQNGVYSKVKA